MTIAADLRAHAESVATGLPPMLAEAEHLASTVLLGEHGRRRAGLGDTFWQYRPAQSHDAMRAIELYGDLLDVVSGASVFIEEFSRQMIAAEEEHCMELRKMVRDVQQ